MNCAPVHEMGTRKANCRCIEIYTFDPATLETSATRVPGTPFKGKAHGHGPKWSPMWPVHSVTHVSGWTQEE